MSLRLCVNQQKGAGGDDEGAIVLHEDKNYYPDAQEVYPGVNTVLLDEDAQDLTEPLLKPVKAKTFSVLAHDVPELVRMDSWPILSFACMLTFFYCSRLEERT